MCQCDVSNAEFINGECVCTGKRVIINNACECPKGSNYDPLK